MPHHNRINGGDVCVDVFNNHGERLQKVVRLISFRRNITKPKTPRLDQIRHPAGSVCEHECVLCVFVLWAFVLCVGEHGRTWESAGERGREREHGEGEHMTHLEVL